MAYATDADLQARVPATAALTSAQRALALDDAEAEIDDRVFGDMAVRAHCMLAAHHLQLGGFIAGGEGGTVTSRRAGEISVSYATPDVSASGPNGSTSYGRRFDAIMAKAGHAPLTDHPTGLWP